MPIFEYRCSDCGHEFDHLVLSKNDPAPYCPNCRAAEVVKLMSAGNIISSDSHVSVMDSGGGGCAPSGG